MVFSWVHRHPSNLMLDRLSGKILHIDFGDCFEVKKNVSQVLQHDGISCDFANK